MDYCGLERRRFWLAGCFKRMPANPSLYAKACGSTFAQTLSSAGGLLMPPASQTQAAKAPTRSNQSLVTTIVKQLLQRVWRDDQNNAASIITFRPRRIRDHFSHAGQDEQEVQLGVMYRQGSFRCSCWLLVVDGHEIAVPSFAAALKQQRSCPTGLQSTFYLIPNRDPVSSVGVFARLDHPCTL